jgi:nitrogen-specific signal transduction histidine kinase
MLRRILKKAPNLVGARAMSWQHRLAHAAGISVTFAVVGFLVAQHLAARAGKSTVEDGVSLETRIAACSPEAFRNAGGGADIVVRDGGIGMSAQDVARVGERFLQADGRLSRKYEGTGLGLVIAKRLIELHGGELIVQSQLGTGTTMILRLPAFLSFHAKPPRRNLTR